MCREVSLAFTREFNRIGEAAAGRPVPRLGSGWPLTAAQDGPRWVTLGRGGQGWAAVASGAMTTLKEAAAAVGYTPEQARKRLAFLAPFLDGSVQRGPRGAILLSEEAVELLRRVRELEAAGHNLREAVALALGQGGPGRPTETSGSATVAKGEAAGRPTPAQGGPRSEEAELVKILWVLVGILAFATAATVGLGVAALLAR